MSFWRENRQMDFSYITPAYAARQSRLDKIHAEARRMAIESMEERGVKGLRCDECGTVHSIYRAGHCCGQMWDDGTAEGHMCTCDELSEVK